MAYKASTVSYIHVTYPQFHGRKVKILAQMVTRIKKKLCNAAGHSEGTILRLQPR